VARDLIGRFMVRPVPGDRLVGRIVECEAYQEGDPASHSFRGPTPRTEVMFGPPGHLYVYFTYGMHFCMNVVTGEEGEGSAVLLRAVEPLEGIDWMRARRGVTDVRLLCAGPGRLTQAFGIDRAHNGLDLVAGDVLFVAAGAPDRDRAVGVSPRVGLTVAADRPWRFFEAGSSFLSRRTWPRPLPSVRGSAREKETGSGKRKGRAPEMGTGKARERGRGPHPKPR
jgi:DNA-3-methyladenine glycosylase